jgi:hypothetical protein
LLHADRFLDKRVEFAKQPLLQVAPAHAGDEGRNRGHGITKSGE